MLPSLNSRTKLNPTYLTFYKKTKAFYSIRIHTTTCTTAPRQQYNTDTTLHNGQDAELKRATTEDINDQNMKLRHNSDS
jgi:hypothetical protein